MIQIPEISSGVWLKILKSNHNFDQLAIQLLSTRLKRLLEASPENEQDCIAQMHRFFTKYQKAYGKALNEIIEKV